MTPVLLYARAALAWTKKKCSPRNEKLKANIASETEEQIKERLRIRRENEKIENHEKQRLATLKRLKRGDDNDELKRNLRLEKVVAGIFFKFQMLDRVVRPVKNNYGLRVCQE